jgi:NitT/TauT family transport system substrate-binding protein
MGKGLTVMKGGPEGRFSRRALFGGAIALGTAGLVGLKPETGAADPPPETTRLRIAAGPAICVAPQYLAKQFLADEGFTDVQYPKMPGSDFTAAVLSGRVDICLNFVGPLIIRLDMNDPIVILAGGHVGCFELFATEGVRSIRDLKGKTVGVTALGAPEHVFLASMAAYVGLDPRRDIRWLIHPFPESARLLSEGKIDAILGFPPQPQELRARKIGHVVVNSMMDRPWSEYFCCMAYAHKEFVRKYPIATKRALRAIFRGADLCAREPERAAKLLVAQGFTKNYDYALQTMKDVIYDKWRDYDPEDTVRFYALRLHEVGMIKGLPQQIIARGTEWRFLNELKKS